MFQQAVHLPALHLRTQVRLRTDLRLQRAGLTLTPDRQSQLRPDASAGSGRTPADLALDLEEIAHVTQ